MAIYDHVSSANTPTTKRSAKKPRVTNTHKVGSAGLVESTHCKLRNMAIKLQLLPGERLNEAMLTKELGVSRTPLRDAENRLMVEGFLTFSVNRGFFRKSLDAKEIFDLYELRQLMEMAAVRLSVERATDKQLLELESFAQKSAEENVNRTLDEVIARDEEFHERLITLTGNAEMWSSLRNINERIHCVRWIGMNNDSSEFKRPHGEIVRTMRQRRTEESMQLMGEHIGHGLDQIVDKVEECCRRIYWYTGREVRQDQTRELKKKLPSRISVKAIDAGTGELGLTWSEQRASSSIAIEAL